MKFAHQNFRHTSVISLTLNQLSKNASVLSNYPFERWYFPIEGGDFPIERVDFPIEIIITTHCI